MGKGDKRQTKKREGKKQKQKKIRREKGKVVGAKSRSKELRGGGGI